MAERPREEKGLGRAPIVEVSHVRVETGKLVLGRRAGRPPVAAPVLRVRVTTETYAIASPSIVPA
jgi:hypothetical protein